MFSKETEYALRALIYIYAQNAEDNTPGITEIAEAIDAPQHYMAKILQNVAKKGLLKSRKGKGGGFFFTEKMKKESLKNVVNTTEGNSKAVNGCILGLENCSDNNPCPLHEEYAPIRAKINRLLETETIESVSNKTDYFLKIVNAE
jgi:Rrf2 family protein